MTITATRPIAADRLGPTYHLDRSRTDDADDLAEMFRAMSPEARRFRFFQATPRVSVAIARHLCDVDQIRHRAWLARCADATRSVVGEVRAVVDPSGSEAEVAVAVRDDHAGHGLGAALVRHVVDDVASTGVAIVRAEVLADNHRSLRLFASLGFRFDFEDGVLVGRAQVAQVRGRVVGSHDHRVGDWSHSTTPAAAATAVANVACRR